MPITYNQDEGFTIVPEYCPDCEEPRYDTGCDAPGCDGFRCDNCSTGCDRDLDGNGRCASALEGESDEDYAARINRERAAFGLVAADGRRRCLTR